MSRIGKKPIIISNGVEATVGEASVQIKGSKGTLIVPIHPKIKIVQQSEPKALLVEVMNEEDKEQRALWGLTRQLIDNAVQGVQKPFEKSLEFIGVGFRVSVSGNEVNMEVGFSHPVKFTLPEGIEAKVEKQVLTISGIDKQLVGEMAAQIRRTRPPEPYKGKGIRYTDEVVIRKAGKAATKST
ncbi:MAG: 50S ribosomal protein L6 [Patescibacteria group bacterium]|nr:50S ribosomal protein L6 [Patescibacteria group bacterium]MBU2509302.1 50S ribosomal protein L6 [Patescibacteria group bacterium]